MSADLPGWGLTDADRERIAAHRCAHTGRVYLTDDAWRGHLHSCPIHNKDDWDPDDLGEPAGR